MSEADITRLPRRSEPGLDRGYGRARYEDDPLRPRRRDDTDRRRYRDEPNSELEPDAHDEPDEKIVGGGSGAGGRVLAIAAVLFLGLSVVFASAGGFFDGSETQATVEATQAPETSAPFSAGSANVGGSEPSQTASDQDVSDQDVGRVAEGPDAADKPADEEIVTEAVTRQMGFPGPWLDGIQTVCIDPGHGGSDRGRIREADDLFPRLEEAEYTLIQALELRDRLEERGYVVVMTRTTDTDVNADFADVNGDGKTKADSDRDGTFDEIQARINICNRANADLMISIHINGYDTARPSGFETWYTHAREFGQQSRRFAELTHQALGEQMAAAGYFPEARGVKDDGTISVDDSDPTLESHMLITGPELPGRLEPSMMPAVIVEGLFITNPDDAAFLVSDGGISALVTSYEEAIVAYFNEYQF